MVISTIMERSLEVDAMQHICEWPGKKHNGYRDKWHGVFPGSRKNNWAWKFMKDIVTVIE